MTVAYIKDLFYGRVYKDDEILAILARDGKGKTKKGKNMRPRDLQRIRLANGIIRRDNLRFTPERIEQVLNNMKEHYNKGAIVGYGVGYLYTYFRKQGFTLLKHVLEYSIGTLNPMGVIARKKLMQGRRKAFVSPGPDFL